MKDPRLPDGQACPCRAPVVTDGNGVTYWHKESNREFCSAACSLRWYETFWRPYCEHLGRRWS